MAIENPFWADNAFDCIRGFAHSSTRLESLAL
jgi:hypothetical protein